ncbi:MAG TPA: tetratricopeptide repeat protein [Rhodopila sp.]|nr:tetratricopeptide repeat protein [Rhodopila sp.]
MASPVPLEAAIRHLAAAAWLEAETEARAALVDDPANPEATLVLGLAVAAMGEEARAAPILTRAASGRPEAEHPCRELARLQPPLPRPLVARQFRACLRAAPRDERLRLGFAQFLLDTDQPEEVLHILPQGVGSAAAYHLRGQAEAEQDRFSDAIASFRHAVALDPAAAASWSNLGIVAKVEGRFADAIAAHDQAVGLQPENPRFRVNRAVALLKAGLWDRAWQDYEARFDLPGAVSVDPARLMPSLRPDDRLAGVTILAQHEDGFGDTLQFLRYLPLLAERGARVVASVPPPLAQVMRGVAGVTEVVADPRFLPAHDFVCPMFSLPRVFATTVGTIPPVPPVAWDKGLAQHWARWLPTSGLRAGLVWAGQARPSLPGFATLDRRRSAGLAAFAPLSEVQGVSFVSLQAGPAARQRRPAKLDMVDPMPVVRDFADTAAIIANLDVVVSVDTSVVHLAGLVGRPVFLLDRYDGCWRWLSGRDDSPWYPGLTIFRQDRPGDWSGAMARVAAALRAMALRPGARARTIGVTEQAFVA